MQTDPWLKGITVSLNQPKPSEKTTSQFLPFTRSSVVVRSAFVVPEQPNNIQAPENLSGRKIILENFFGGEIVELLVK